MKKVFMLVVVFFCPTFSQYNQNISSYVRNNSKDSITQACGKSCATIKGVFTPQPYPTEKNRLNIRMFL